MLRVLMLLYCGNNGFDNRKYWNLRKEKFRWQEITRDIEQYLPVIAVSTGLRFADLLRTNYGLQLLMLLLGRYFQPLIVVSPNFSQKLKMIPCNIHQISNLQRNHLVSFQFAVIDGGSIGGV